MIGHTVVGSFLRKSFALGVVAAFPAMMPTSSFAQVPAALKMAPNLVETIDHPLRYRPDGGDFVIVNGAEFFNRPLYGGNTGFRVDAGDKPEFTLYLPGRGGNLRLGIKSAAGTKWLAEAREVVARYRPGAMHYTIADDILGGGSLELEVLAMNATEGLVLRAQGRGLSAGVELVWAFGGITGQRGTRDGDIGTERVPISEYFQLSPEFCKDNAFTLDGGVFTLRAKPATIRGLTPPGARLALADAKQWASFDALAASTPAAGAAAPELPVVIGRVVLGAEPLHLALQRLPLNAPAEGELDTYRDVTTTRPGAAAAAPPAANRLAAAYAVADLPRVFTETDAHFAALRAHVRIETPDPYLNAAMGALNVAADAVWDEPQGAVMHGAIAWRSKLLGWRGPYAQDALGWHERARRHLTYWTTRQNTDPIPGTLAPPEEATNLARSRTALHSNGDMSQSHYDMNTVYIDALFRHLRWTGDLDFARQVWPVIERHLAWERRLFRRPFGADGAPLYEAYAVIWASDDLQYNGGGATHSSAYQVFHNRLAADLARRLGKDATIYEREADAVARAMRTHLWLPERGWFAEFKDLLGKQSTHPAAALWTFYHTADSEVFTPLEAWQMTRYVDTEIPRIPVRGPGVPTDDDYHTLSSTNWMPYSWSINNVVMGEVVHTALGYWQAGRAEEANRLVKSSLLSAMFMGICPGNVGSMSYLDVYRRESQRDFADGGGVLSRALIEGLFGVKPNVLAGELMLTPGFPAAWDHASLKHPNLDVEFRREGLKDRYIVTSRFPKPMDLRMVVTARLDDPESVTINGEPAQVRIPHSVGRPSLHVEGTSAKRQEVVIVWRGKPIAPAPDEVTALVGSEVRLSVPNVELVSDGLLDLQGAFTGLKKGVDGFRGKAVGIPGHRTLFALVKQSAFTWFQPVAVKIESPDTARAAASTDWAKSVEATAKFSTVDLTARFNDRVTQIFKNEYRAPRSPYVSLAMPKQGIGAWAGHVNDTAEIDDAGLRAKAAAGGGRLMLPNGVPFATPGSGDAKNILFTSLWKNYPPEAAVPLTGRARHAYLLMAGSTYWMQSRFDNAEVVVTYTDGTTARLALNNPVNWWPIEQDYFIDDFQFRRPEPIPPRVDLKTGAVRLLDPKAFAGKGRRIPGGAASVLDLPLDPAKELKTLTVRTLANEVVVGLMAVTLRRE